MIETKREKKDPRIEKALKLIDVAVETHARAIDKLLEAKLALAAEPSTASVVKRLFDCWAILWTRRYSGTYVFAGTKDGAQIKRLLKTMSGEEIARRMKAYLQTDDEWLHDRKHPLNVFLSSINRYAKDEIVPQEFVLASAVGCHHEPRCKSDLAHTRKVNAELRS